MKTHRFSKFLPVFAVAALTLLPCCTRGEGEKVQRDMFAMDTLITLTAYGKNASPALDEAASQISRLDSLFSPTLENSDTYKINNAGGKSVTVSSDTAALLNTAREVSEKFDGAFDITVYPIVEEWGFIGKNYTVPSNEKLASLLSLVDYTRVTVSGSTVLCSENVSIDPGAIAKGYASQLVTQHLHENGVTAALVSLGGNVQTLGEKPDGTKWEIAIADPLASESDTVGTLSVGETAVVTSGSYQRFFEREGKTYHHIIDPATGAPAESSLLSVTVVCENGAVCDAVSTALFVSGLEKSLGYYEKYSDFEAVFITQDKRIVVTDGLKDSFNFTSNGKYTYEQL